MSSGLGRQLRSKLVLVPNEFWREPALVSPAQAFALSSRNSPVPHVSFGTYVLAIFVVAYAFYGGPFGRRDVWWKLDRYGSYIKAGNSTEAAARISVAGECSRVLVTGRVFGLDWRRDLC